jgi:hypothetical protein
MGIIKPKKTGKRVITGIVTIGTSARTLFNTVGSGFAENMYYATVRGLDFRPSTVFLLKVNDYDYMATTILSPEGVTGEYTNDALLSNPEEIRIYVSSYAHLKASKTTYPIRLKGSAMLYDDGFSLPTATYGDFQYWAYE